MKKKIVEILGIILFIAAVFWQSEIYWDKLYENQEWNIYTEEENSTLNWTQYMRHSYCPDNVEELENILQENANKWEIVPNQPDGYVMLSADIDYYFTEKDLENADRCEEEKNGIRVTTYLFDEYILKNVSGYHVVFQNSDKDEIDIMMNLTSSTEMTEEIENAEDLELNGYDKVCRGMSDGNEVLYLWKSISPLEVYEAGETVTKNYYCLSYWSQKKNHKSDVKMESSLDISP